MIAEPPSLAGAVHERSMLIADVAVAERDVGVPGTVNVVSVAEADASPVPTALIAETRYSAVSPVDSVASERVVAVVPVSATRVANPPPLRFLSIK